MFISPWMAQRFAMMNMMRAAYSQQQQPSYNFGQFGGFGQQSSYGMPSFGSPFGYGQQTSNPYGMPSFGNPFGYGQQTSNPYGANSSVGVPYANGGMSGYFQTPFGGSQQIPTQQAPGGFNTPIPYASTTNNSTGIYANPVETGMGFLWPAGVDQAILHMPAANPSFLNYLLRAAGGAGVPINMGPIPRDLGIPPIFQGAPFYPQTATA